MVSGESTDSAPGNIGCAADKIAPADLQIGTTGTRIARPDAPAWCQSLSRMAIAAGAMLPQTVLLLVPTILIIAASSVPARAQCDTASSTCSWNAGTGSWFTGTNWTTSPGPPTSTSTVTVSNGGTANIDATGAVSSNTTIDDGSAIVVESGDSWNNAGSSPSFNEEGGAIIVGDTGTGGALTIDNGGTVTTTGASNVGTVLLGEQADSAGTITLGNGGTGTALLTTTAADGANFYVGYGGSGTLNVNAGGSITGFDGMELGVLAGSSGTVTVNAGSLAAGGVMTVGGAGAGTLTIENGGTVTATSAAIASAAGADGSSATVTGTNSTWTLTGDLQVGIGGNGSLTIADGGSVSAGAQIYLGDGTGGGIATVNGGTLSGGETFIGTVGSGTSSLLVENGGVVTTSGPTFIGISYFSGTSTGTVTLTGSGSSWSIGTGPSDYMEIENIGTVTGLTVENGAALTTGETLIGGYISSAGNNAVVVTGAGTTWQSGAIILGDAEDSGPGSGTGTLSIAAGAQVSVNANVDIGYTPDGGGGITDSVTVDGSGSKLTTTGDVRVGYLGTGALTISNGGQVSDVEGDIAYSSTNSTVAFYGGSTTPTNSVGSAIVTGAGSLWQNTTLIVGDNTTSPGSGYGTGTSTGTLTISDGGEVASTNAIMVGANAGATGTINIGAAVGQTPVAPGTISAPAIDFGTGGGTIVFNHTSASYTFAIPIEGGGSVDVESGTTALTATNTYTGTTIINGGTLEVDGSIADTSSVTVNSTGTLSGVGTVDPATTTINSGGVLAPGSIADPTGALAITGNLSFSTGGAYSIALTPTTHSLTNVVGAVTINNNVTAELTPHLGNYAASSFAILTATGALTGTFDPTIAYTGSYKLNGATLTYNGSDGCPADDVCLSYQATLESLQLPPGASTNEQNVANGINDAISAGDVLPPLIQNLADLSGQSLLNALTQLDGGDATGAEQGSFTLMSEFLDLMGDQGFGGGGGGSGGNGGLFDYAPDAVAGLPPQIASAYDSVFKAPPPTPGSFDQRWSAWGSAFGGGSFADGNATVGSNNVTTTTYGYAGGMDYRATPDTLYGFALAGSGLNWGLANALGTGRSDAFQAGVHGRTNFGPAYLSGSLAFGNNWFSTSRSALGEQLSASFSGQSYAARFEGGYRYALPAPGGRAAIGVTPYAALQTQWFHTPAYSESGGVLALAYNSLTANDTRTELGARFDNFTTLNSTPLILRARLAWAHDFVSNPALSAAFESLSGSSFTVNGAPIPHDSALTSASAQWWLTPAWSFTAKFDGEFASSAQIYGGSGTLRYTW